MYIYGLPFTNTQHNIIVQNLKNAYFLFSKKKKTKKFNEKIFLAKLCYFKYDIYGN